MIEWHKNDLGGRVYCNLPDNKKKSMPRYYRDKIYSSEERGWLKGHFEKMHQEKDMELIRKNKVPTVHDREQAVLAAYRNMSIADKKFTV